MNFLYYCIFLCSLFLSILWFVLAIYKIIYIKLNVKYSYEYFADKAKFSYVFLIALFIVYTYIALFKWYKYQIVFSIIEGILISLITVGIIAFLYVDHYLTTKPLNKKYNKKLYSRIRKYSAIAVSVCMIMFDIVPFLFNL